MKGLIPLIFLLLLTTSNYALEECKGTTEQDEIPCLVFLPSSSNCSTINLSFYNVTTLLDNRVMHQYNPFMCNVTFNYSEIGTYTGNYTTGDTLSIIVERGNMNFFSMFVYLTFMFLAIVFIVLMNLSRENTANSIVYGWISTALSSIMGAIILSPNFSVIHGVNLFFEADVYLSIISFMLALYTAIASVNIKRSSKPTDSDFWAS